MYSTKDLYPEFLKIRRKQAIKQTKDMNIHFIHTHTQINIQIAIMQTKLCSIVLVIQESKLTVHKIPLYI